MRMAEQEVQKSRDHLAIDNQDRKRWPGNPNSERQRAPWDDLKICRRTYYRWKRAGKVK